MKNILLFIVLSLSHFAQAETISFNQLVGSYTVESKEPVAVLGDGVSIRYDIRLNANETTNLTEKIIQTIEEKETVLMQMVCTGPVTIDSSQSLISNVTCSNGEDFIQKVTLTEVDDISAESFTAPVFSSLYGMTVDMIFKRRTSK